MMCAMKRIVILLAGAALLAAACRNEEDTRYFAPEVTFESLQYTVPSDAGGVDVWFRLSRPAPQAFTIGVRFAGMFAEGVQFKVASHELAVPEGAEDAKLHIELVDDEIWEENGWLEVIIAPGKLYTVDPAGKYAARITVTKDIVMPVLSFETPAEPLETNPYRAEPLILTVKASEAPKFDIPVQVKVGDMEVGKDYVLSGAEGGDALLSAGATSAEIKLEINKIDQSGLDIQVPVTLVAVKGKYVVGQQGSAVDIHLYDPVVNFAPLWKYSANNNGEGYQFRQAIKGPDEAWNGNLAADFFVSSEGSNYIRNIRNMYSSSWSCMANSSGGNAFRLTEFFPELAYPAETGILDYGAGATSRFFSPVDSLFRFVLDKGSTTQGDVLLDSPRTFIAFTGLRADWEAGSPKAWHLDSKATKGDIFLSESPILTGRVHVTLERMEGRFDFSDTKNTLRLTVWFRCDSPLFMKGIDETKMAVTQEADGTWKVEYNIWPRT